MQAQTWDDQLEEIVLQFQKRQIQTKRIIRKYIARYSSGNPVLSVPGAFVAIPGSGILTIMASLLAQSSVIFQPLAEEIAAIYLPSWEARPQDLPLEGASQSTTDLATRAASSEQFYTPVIQALIRGVIKGLFAHYVPVMALEGMITWLPLPDGVTSATINAQILRRLTLRVGVLVAAFFENGQQWIGGSLAKMNDVLQNFHDDSISVDSIPFLPEVCEGMITRLLAGLHTVYEQSDAETYQAIHQILAEILRLKFLQTSFGSPE